MEQNKKTFYVDYGARMTDNRSSCVIMKELKEKAKINDNDPNASVLLRNYILNNGKQLSKEQTDAVIAEQRKKYM